MSSHCSSELPDIESTELARTSAQALSQLLADRPAADRARVQLEELDLVLPRDALTLLRDMLSEMAQGHAITLMPTHAELTTQQAADMLGVSRPYLVGLLERGDIAFTKTGAHRRIWFQDVADYKTRQLATSKKRLTELAQQAQDHGMGY